MTLGLLRWSRGSVERQTGQAQPIIGTPALVPVPRKSNSSGMNAFYPVEKTAPIQHVANKFDGGRTFGASLNVNAIALTMFDWSPCVEPSVRR
ncbi:MAG: hypothetical protein HC898_10805 [Phycisphaerales bacterium]|nr:hypothetical protein [Phycisphaerales bacterium]